MSYLSNQTKVRDFINGPVWADMLRELEEWKKDIAGQYPDCETLKELGQVNGRLQALTYFIGLPHVILANLEEIAQLREEGALDGQNADADAAEEEYLSDLPD